MSEELVGRDRELGAALAALTQAQSSIVTFWGPGGIGKTRLAREVARRLSSAFAGGIHFCALGQVRTASELYAVVEEELGLFSGAPRTPDDAMRRIAASLAARGKVLVILDNTEQIVAQAARALAAWSTRAPAATFLVTSRELLGVAGETPIELSCLGVPAEGCAAGDSDAVRLLVKRARELRPDFDAPGDVLGEVVRRLDGIPLALELAAARLAVMSAEQLNGRLARRFDLLGPTPAVDRASRRSLRGAIDWSWDLLSDRERVLLAELSIFRGSFELEAVEAVASAGALAHGLLGALRVKSLVAPAPAGAALPGPSAPRFLLFESIREYAREKLGQGWSDAADRHAAYFVGRALEEADAVNLGEASSALARFAPERDDHLGVLEDFLSHPSPARARWALGMLVPLGRLLSVSGSSGLLVERGRLVLQAAEAFEVEPSGRMRALEAYGTAAFAVADLAGARGPLEEAHTMAKAAGLEDQARVGNALGMVLQAQGLLVQAKALQEASLAAAEQAGSEGIRAHCLGALGACHLMLGDAALARACLEASLAAHRRTPDVLAQARAAARLAFAMLDAQDVDGAEGALDEALLSLANEETGRSVEGLLLGYRGNVMREKGAWTAARALYRRASELLELAGDRRYALVFRMDDAVALELQGRYEEAARILGPLVVATREIGDRTLGALVWGYDRLARAMLGERGPDDGVRATPADRMAEAGDAGARRSLAVHDAHVGLIEARRRHDAPAMKAALARARRLLREAPASGHPRLAAGFLSRTVEAMAPSRGSLVVDASGDRLRLPGGRWVDMSARPAMRRVFLALLDERMARPGAALSVDALVRAGWPDERLLRRAGTNRLRVLLTGMRSQGLRGLLENAKGGYLLSAKVPVVRGDPLED